MCEKVLRIMQNQTKAGNTIQRVQNHVKLLKVEVNHAKGPDFMSFMGLVVIIKANVLRKF